MFYKFFILFVLLLFFYQVGFSQALVVNGKVSAKEGVLANVTVALKGGTISTQTNANGEYSINALSTGVLVFSFVGYQTTEIPIASRTMVNVILVKDDTQIDEVTVVATGYQNLNPKLFTGSAISLKGFDVIQEGVTDISRALEGRAAGVSVQNVSGTFGAAPKVRIRGASSITGDNKPLWVIDGIILEDVVNVSNDQLTSGDVSTLIGSSVAGLNMDDIEDINILKDAAATAQYGARAMNGVIVIRTKMDV